MTSLRLGLYMILRLNSYFYALMLNILFLLVPFTLCFLLACGSSDEVGADSPECVVTNCHGKEVTCGFGELSMCSQEYQIGDQCRQFVSCENQDGTCSPVKSSNYQACVDCVSACEGKESTEAFKCDELCRSKL